MIAQLVEHCTGITVQTSIILLSICFLPQYQRQRIFFRARAEKGIARHIDVSSVVRTLIENGKLVNQIARLAEIVVKLKTPLFRYFYNHLSNYTETIIRLRLVNIGEYSPRLRLRLTILI